MSDSTKLSWLKYTWLANFSKPVHHRWLLKNVNSRQVRHMVHVGIGDGELATRMIEVARRNTEERICFTGIDLFEGAGSRGLSLKNAHALLKSHGAKVKLIPGDVYSALARPANELTNVDCLVLDQFDAEALERSWIYVPRMLHEGSLVCQLKTNGDGGTQFTEVDRAWIDQQANRWQSRRAA